MDLNSENTLTTHIKHDLNLTTQGGEVHTINQTGELHIDQGSASITAHELQIHAGGTTVMLDGEGIWVKTGGETIIGDASATTNDTATEAQVAVAGSQSEQQKKSDTTKSSSENNSAVQTDQPNMYPKVTLEFESNTLALNEYIDGPYHIQTTATVSGTIDMVNTHSVNPMVVDKEGLKAQAKAAANQLFAELKVGKIDGDLNDHATMILGLENQNLEIALSPPITIPGGYRLYGEVADSLQPIEKNNWKITGNVTTSISITATKNNNSDGAFSRDLQKDWDDIKDYLSSHAIPIADSMAQQAFRAVKFAGNNIAEGGDILGTAELDGLEVIASKAVIVLDYLRLGTAEVYGDV